MPSATRQDDLALARELVAAAAVIALEHQRRGVNPRSKSDDTPVTEADLAVEHMLRDRLAAERPDDGVLGEELGGRGSSGRRWILDPIDGTSHFIAGRPDWGTHVALEEAGEILVGAVSRPARNATWWASRGGGAFRSDHATSSTSPLRVSSVERLSRSRVGVWTSESSDWLERLSRHATRVESDLDDLLRLAEGELEVVIDVSGRAWDHAPLVVIVEEAGGRFSDRDGGHQIDQGEGRFSNGLVHDELVRVLDGA